MSNMKFEAPTVAFERRLVEIWIKNKFEQVLREKLLHLGSEVCYAGFAPDNPLTSATEIHKCLVAGAELLVTSGGMSVDPDDVPVRKSKRRGR